MLFTDSNKKQVGAAADEEHVGHASNSGIDKTAPIEDEQHPGKENKTLVAAVAEENKPLLEKETKLTTEKMAILRDRLLTIS